MKIHEEKQMKYDLSFFYNINSQCHLQVKQKNELQKLEKALDEITLYHVQEITFEEKEKMPRKEAFENVLGSIQEEGIQFVYLILGDERGVSFYLGLVQDMECKNLKMPIYDMGEYLLKPSIQGNFRGSKIERLDDISKKNILETIQNSKNFGNILGIPGINETNDKNSFQGIDRLVDVMENDSFGLCILAKPMSREKIYEVEENLFEIFNGLSLYVKRSVQGGRNTSDSSSLTTGTSTSKTAGLNSSKGTNTGKNVSISSGKNSNESYSKGKNWSESTGKNYSKNHSETEGKNESSGGSSSSSGKSYSKTGGESIGENENISSGTSSTASYSNGESETETRGKSTGESQSTGTSHSKTVGQNESKNITESSGESLNVSTEIINKKYQDYLKYMDEILFPMLDYGKSKGLYVTSSFIFTNKKEGTLRKLGNTMKSLFSGKKGNKNPLTLEILEPEDKKIEYFKNLQIPKSEVVEDRQKLALYSYVVEDYQIDVGNWYSSNELSLMAGLPQKEVVGLSLKEEVEFGLNIPRDSKKLEEKIELGELIQSGNLRNIPVYLNKEDLNKHIFISGVTGTGKTTTCQRLLLESKLPFLVIEPAKTEYRILMDKKETQDILIFTLGKDTIAPFRLNPFEFFEHESITSRVDMLKAAIESSFDMEAAIPQLIESAMYECYKDYGWDIDTNTNSKFLNPFAKGVYSFPILKDLLEKIEVEVEKQGFDERLKKDYIGSIKARLQGLLVGSKGLMLNTYRGIDFKELLEKKVVLEIEEIKNGAEKALIIGFVLTNLCEALKAKHKENKDFKHITLVEEAHRLLSKYTPGDSPNKKQGVETFSDMLAEVRKYGESLIIADQIPNKMTPEVLKNTNTKIIHKIFAEDDKEAIGNTISLTKEQKNFLSSLSTGRAIVFSQGWDKALQVQIKNDTDTTKGRYIDDTELRDRVQQFYKKEYQSGIFAGTKFFDRELTDEELDTVRRLSRNTKNYKILDSIFQKNKTLFEDKKSLFSFIEDEIFWKWIEQIFTEADGKLDVSVFRDLSKYNDKYGVDILYEIIYNKYYYVSLSGQDEKTYKQVIELVKKHLNNLLDISPKKPEKLEDIWSCIENGQRQYISKHFK